MARILFLYSEMMPYMEAVIKSLVIDYKDEVRVVSWDKKNLTPHRPGYPEQVITYNRSSLNDEGIMSLILEFCPEIIYVSGRMDSGYLKAVRKLKQKIPVVAGCDNQWSGTIKQRLASLISYLLYRRYFTHIWVPGHRQFVYASKMGYNNRNILIGEYSGNTFLFNEVAAHRKQSSFSPAEKRVLFLGRLEKIKAPDLLVEAFGLLPEKIRQGWKLTFIGSGSLAELISKNDYVEILGFMSQESIKDWIAQRDIIFCLPSRKEPWGVVVHEMAAAGLPLIVTHEVGAGPDFVINGHNGKVVPPNDIEALSRALEHLMEKTLDERIEMGVVSYELSRRFSPSINAASLRSVLK